MDKIDIYGGAYDLHLGPLLQIADANSILARFKRIREVINACRTRR